MQRTIHLGLAYLLSAILGYLVCYFVVSHKADVLTIIQEIVAIPLLIVYSVTWFTKSVSYLFEVAFLLITLITAIAYVKYKNYYFLALFFVFNGIVSFDVVYFYWAVSSV